MACVFLSVNVYDDTLSGHKMASDPPPPTPRELELQAVTERGCWGLNSTPQPEQEILLILIIFSMLSPLANTLSNSRRSLQSQGGQYSLSRAYEFALTITWDSLVMAVGEE